MKHEAGDNLFSFTLPFLIWLFSVFLWVDTPIFLRMKEEKKRRKEVTFITITLLTVRNCSTTLD